MIIKSQLGDKRCSKIILENDNYRVESSSELIDLMSTILDMAGIEKPFGLQGISLEPFLYDKEYKPREYCVIESGEDAPPFLMKDISKKPSGPFDGSMFVWCACREA